MAEVSCEALHKQLAGRREDLERNFALLLNFCLLERELC